MSGEIAVKGWRNGLLLVLPSEGPWPEVIEGLEGKLEEAKTKTFWQGAQTTLDLGDRPVSEPELEELIGRLKGDYGLVPMAIVAAYAPTREGASKLGLTIHDKLPAPEKVEKTEKAEKAEEPQFPPNNALYLRTTVRSGQRLQHDGHLVISGDVNAGAEIVAAGDIVVFGTLRGVAHAGSAGDESARIIATNLRPTQIRIASLIARSPDAGAPPLSKSPEIASIKDGEIHISPL
ncbi:Septum site-determining protein MinC [compost metagenome]